jgi:prevent-host-death family protein
MISLKDEIDSLSNFKRNTADYLKQLKKSGKPVVLTVNGRAELIVQDAASYQRLLEISERLETIEALRPAIEEMKAGKGEPVEAFFSKLLSKEPSRTRR